MLALKTLLLTTLTYASPIAIHSASSTAADTLVQDVTNIHHGVLANQAFTAVYTGGDLVTSLVEGTPVLATVADIHIVNRKGYVDANVSPKLDEGDTQRLFDHVRDTVGVSIPSDIQTVIEQKTAFEYSGMGPLVLAGLQLLINDHDTFSAAVEAKSYQGNAALTAEGVEVVKEVHDAIQSGIDAYST